jgi:hypothetical protein
LQLFYFADYPGLNNGAAFRLKKSFAAAEQQNKKDINFASLLEVSSSDHAYAALRTYAASYNSSIPFLSFFLSFYSIFFCTVYLLPIAPYF